MEIWRILEKYDFKIRSSYYFLPNYDFLFFLIK